VNSFRSLKIENIRGDKKFKASSKRQWKLKVTVKKDLGKLWRYLK
jgi:hypothetical protein